mmetsp:Transcript_10242/g.22735  ORF Transcript_10242/g.22735 Transcript_10242/m.22735 type:complete len:81 (-) Transcript_10242:2171-2413(-)
MLLPEMKNTRTIHLFIRSIGFQHLMWNGLDNAIDMEEEVKMAIQFCPEVLRQAVWVLVHPEKKGLGNVKKNLQLLQYGLL